MDAGAHSTHWHEGDTFFRSSFYDGQTFVFMSALQLLGPGYRPDNQLDEFESQARLISIRLEATQLTSGDAKVGFGVQLMGDTALAAYQTTHTLGMIWEARPQSLSFSIRVGASGMKLEGRERAPYSVVMYVEPGTASWTGIIDGSVDVGRVHHPSYHISVPFEAVNILGIPRAHVRRGWLELPLIPDVAEGFARWANEVLWGLRQDNSQDDVYWWLAEALKPVLQEPPLESPSHYTRIIAQVVGLADQHLENPISITEMSQQLRISVRTIQRAFQTVFGMGVSRFLRHRRLKRAMSLLRMGETTVYRAAYATGFHHVPRFSQQYRRLFGHSPSQAL